jgi:hypothetical protein
MKKSKKGKEKMQATYEDMEDDDTSNYKKALMRLAEESLDFNEVLVLTYHKNEDIRSKALQRLCPCRVGDEYEQFWSRIFQMVGDPSGKIRYQVLHNMCDGSPPSMEDKVVEALEVFNRDPDQEVKRKAHKVMASYLRTGKWNVL